MFFNTIGPEWTDPSCQGIGHVAGLVDALKAAGCERIFTETASGAQRDRPELARALDYMRKGDVLVVWKLDRLARSIKQLIETIELLDGEGIGFQSVTEAMDTTTPGGRLLFHICGALAELERGIIRELTAAGLAAARAQGRTNASGDAELAPASSVANIARDLLERLYGTRATFKLFGASHTSSPCLEAHTYWSGRSNARRRPQQATRTGTETAVADKLEYV